MTGKALALALAGLLAVGGLGAVLASTGSSDELDRTPLIDLRKDDEDADVEVDDRDGDDDDRDKGKSRDDLRDREQGNRAGERTPGGDSAPGGERTRRGTSGGAESGAPAPVPAQQAAPEPAPAPAPVPYSDDGGGSWSGGGST